MKTAPGFSQIKEVVKKDCLSLKSAFASRAEEKKSKKIVPL